MTNLKTITGGIAWMATAALLLLATLEPVQVNQQTDIAFAQAVAANPGL